MNIFKTFFVWLAAIILSANTVYSATAELENFTDTKHLHEMLKNSTNQLTCAQNEISILQENNYNLKITLEEKNKKLAELQNYIFSLEQSYENNNKFPEEFKNNELLKEELDSCKNKINEYTNRLEEYKLSVRSCENRINSHIAKIKEYENIISNNTQEINLYKNEIISLNNEISGLNKQICNAKNNTISIANKEKELSEINNNIVYWKTRAQNLEKELLEANDIIQSNSKTTANDEFVNFAKSSPDTNSQYYYIMGKMFLRNKNYTEAIASYNSALKTNPDFAKAYCELAIAYTEAKEYNNAVKSFEKYLTFVNNPDEKTVINKFVSRIQTISR